MFHGHKWRRSSKAQQFKCSSAATNAVIKGRGSSHSVGVVDPLLPGRIYLFCSPETFSQMMRRTPSPTGGAGRQQSRQRQTRSDTNKMLPQSRNLLHFHLLLLWKMFGSRLHLNIFFFNNIKKKTSPGLISDHELRCSSLATVRYKSCLWALILFLNNVTLWENTKRPRLMWRRGLKKELV